MDDRVRAGGFERRFHRGGGEEIQRNAFETARGWGGVATGEDRKTLGSQEMRQSTPDEPGRTRYEDAHGLTSRGRPISLSVT